MTRGTHQEESLAGARASASDRLRANLCIVLLCIAAITPILATPLPPLYDYYHWVLEGKLLSQLAFGSGTERAEVAAVYQPVLAPVPNQSSSWGLALLCRVAPPLVAGRIFLSACVLSFALGFAFLVRSMHGRPTITELLAFPWASGYFLYRGYLSYLLSVGLTFFAIAFLLRSRRAGDDPPRGRRWLALSALATALFLSHVVPWGVFATFLFVDVVAVARRKDFARAARLAAVLVPSLVLLVWYALTARGDHEIELYYHVPTKLLSLFAPLLFFIRLDPYPPALPVFGLNVAAFLAVGAAVALAVGWRRFGIRSRWLGAAALLLAAGAICFPFAVLGEMLRPDERLVLPAVLLGLAALAPRRWTLPKAGFVVAAAAAILLIHVAEYRGASREFVALHRAMDEVIPADQSVLSIALRPPTAGTGCRLQGLPTVGIPASKWIGVLRLLEDGVRRVNLMPTSVIARRASGDDPDDFHITSRQRAEIPDLGDDVRWYSERYDYLMLLGCADDIRDAETAVGAFFVEVRAGAGFALLGPANYGKPRSG